MEKITLVIPLGITHKVEDLDTIKSQKNPIKLIIEKGPNPSENRNRGIKKAKTPLIAFINGHTALAENWAEKIEEFFKTNPDIDIVGGPQLNYEKGNYFSKISSYALSSVFGAAAVSTRYKKNKINLNADETMLTSANLICRKRVFKKIKFDESIYPGEDPKLISDAKKAGFKIAYSPEIIVFNRRRSSLNGLIKQIYNYGKVRPIKEKFTETLKQPFFLVPSVFLLYLAAILILALFSQLHIIFLIPLFAYVLLSIYFSLLNAALNKDIIAGILLPFMYLAIHLSYGYGFLVTSLKKLFKRK